MRLKEAILAKGEKAHDFPSTCFGIDFRGYADNYKTAYTNEQLHWLWNHGLLEESMPNERYFEDCSRVYWQWTKIGKFFRVWFTTSFWDYISIYVLHLWWFKNVWQRFMIKVFHKHYAWQEYEDVTNLDEI
jgi:hypothetical protein